MAKNPWFDDLPADQRLEIAQKIRKAEDIIEKGWIVGTRQRGNKVCLVGAISLAVYDDAYAFMRDDPVIKGITHSIAAELGTRVPLIPQMSADMAATFLIQVNDSSSDSKKIIAAMDRAAEHFEIPLGVSAPPPKRTILDRILFRKAKRKPPENNAFADARQEDMDLAAGPGH